MSRETCQSTLQVDTDASYRTFHKSIQYFKGTSHLLAIFIAVMLASCSHSSGGSTADADPTGYYSSGSATVNLDQSTSTDISDLQALINDDRIMVMSMSETILYDGTITSVKKNDFTANVTIYQAAQNIGTASISGTITEGSKISGTLTGTGLGNGSFEILYAQNNEQESALSRIDDSNGSLVWTSEDFMHFLIHSSGQIQDDTAPNSGPFVDCFTSDGTVTPIAGTNLYSFNLTLDLCNPSVVGDYSGLATTTNSDNVLILAVSNDSTAAIAEYMPQ